MGSNAVLPYEHNDLLDVSRGAFYLTVKRYLFIPASSKLSYNDDGNIHFCFVTLLWRSVGAAGISVLDEDICVRFRTNMQHHYAHMPTWPKPEPEFYLYDVITSTTGNNCNMVFSLHVVENVSDEYNFYFQFCDVIVS